MIMAVRVLLAEAHGERGLGIGERHAENGCHPHPENGARTAQRDGGGHTGKVTGADLAGECGREGLPGRDLALAGFFATGPQLGKCREKPFERTPAQHDHGEDACAQKGDGDGTYLKDAPVAPRASPKEVTENRDIVEESVHSRSPELTDFGKTLGRRMQDGKPPRANGAEFLLRSGWLIGGYGKHAPGPQIIIHVSQIALGEARPDKHDRSQPANTQRVTISAKCQNGFMAGNELCRHLGFIAVKRGEADTGPFQASAAQDVRKARPVKDARRAACGEISPDLAPAHGHQFRPRKATRGLNLDAVNRVQAVIGNRPAAPVGLINARDHQYDRAGSGDRIGIYRPSAAACHCQAGGEYHEARKSRHGDTPGACRKLPSHPVFPCRVCPGLSTMRESAFKR